MLYMGFRATLNFHRKFKVALNPMYRIFLCGLHEVYSRTMLRPDLFIYLFIYLSTRDERLSRGLVSMAQVYSWLE